MSKEHFSTEAKRFEEDLDRLNPEMGHADQRESLREHPSELILPGEHQR